MSDVRPFDAAEIGRLLRSGELVKVGSVMLHVERGTLLARCSCNATATFPGDLLASGIGELERFAVFITRHNHGAA